jgi:hypothetical protein
MKQILFYCAFVAVLLKPGYPKTTGNKSTALSDYQKEVVDYFKEIALGFEFGEATAVTRKWKKPMKIFVGGWHNATLTNELHLVVDELNALVADNFEIEIVSSKAAANFYIFFGAGSQYASMYPSDADLANSNSGTYRIFWNERNEIASGHMFVDIRGTDLDEQKSVLREELTQSLGLGNDSPLYSDSIFQSDWSTPTQYSQMDKDIIRLLYHPAMSIGLSPSQTESILTQILLSENGA